MYPKILFILKQHSSSGGYSYTTNKSGLLNSAKFVQNALREYLCIKSEIKVVIDGNGIDKEVHNYKPDIVVLEALWCPPYKVAELLKLYPKVQWVIRIHSKTPFLANEGIAIQWLTELNILANRFGNLKIAFNAKETYEEFKKLGYHHSSYLPNFYFPDKDEESCGIDHHSFHDKKGINIGCFGAIRPMKNQLIQAMAAIEFANKKNKKLYFHMNAGRIEQAGEQVLKNLEALFKDSEHELVKWSWLEHGTFIKLVKHMNLGLQVSLSESFNIVTGDFVANNIPIIVSEAIDWMPWFTQADTESAIDITKKLQFANSFKKIFTITSAIYLDSYNLKSLFEWKKFIEKKHPH